MPQPTKAELEAKLSQIGELVEEALDPAKTRVELVEILREIEALVGLEEEEPEEVFEEEEDED